MDEELFNATERGDVAAIQRLVGQGANVNCHHPDFDGCTPLHIAVAYGTPEAVRALVDARALLEAKDEEGWTPLHWAARHGSEAAVQTLLGAGAQIEAKDKDGATPLHLATGRGHVEATRALLDAGADVAVENKDGQTPLDDDFVGCKMNLWSTYTATRIAAVKEVIRVAADRKQQEKLEQDRQERESGRATH